LLAAEFPALERWAGENGLLLDAADFDRHWIVQGRRGESEHEVYYEEATGRWWKRNTLNFHSNILEYLYRSALHTFLFPDTALRFSFRPYYVGVMERGIPVMSLPGALYESLERRQAPSTTSVVSPPQGEPIAVPDR
jgi:hypothetical protein